MAFSVFCKLSEQEQEKIIKICLEQSENFENSPSEIRMSNEHSFVRKLHWKIF